MYKHYCPLNEEVLTNCFSDFLTLVKEKRGETTANVMANLLHKAIVKQRGKIKHRVEITLLHALINAEQNAGVKRG